MFFSTPIETSARLSSLDPILGQIAELEQSVVPCPSAKRTSYVALGDWLVRPSRLLKGTLSNQHHMVGVMAGKAALKGYLTYLERGAFHSATKADLINIRAHFLRTGLVRTFYLAGRSPISMKAWLPPCKRETTREAEVRSRVRVREIGCLNVPAILTHGTEGAMEYMIEEFADARLPSHPHDRDHVAKNLLPALKAHYAASGTSIVGIAEYLGADFMRQLESASQSFDWPTSWLSRTAVLSRIEEIYTSGGAAVCGFAHGDLNVSHVGIVRDGRLVIIDWELARHMPVAGDLADLDRTCGNREPSFHNACCAVIESLGSSNDLLCGRDQMLLLSLRRAGRFAHFLEHRRREGRPAKVAAKLMSYFGYAQQLVAEH